MVLEDARDLTYDAVVARARGALRRAVHVPAPTVHDDLAELHHLVGVTRTREPALRARVLRDALCARLAAAGSDPRLSPETDQVADSLLDEYLAVIAEHGLSLFGVDAQVLIAHRALLCGDDENALAAVSTALSHLDEPDLVDRARTDGERADNLGASYRLVARSLGSLGMHENGAGLLDRARVLAEEGGDEMGAAVARYETVLLGLSWGLRLERAGRDGGPRLQAAASTAGAMLACGPPLPEDHQPLLHAARVLGRRLRPPYHHDDGRPAASGHDAARHDAATLQRLHETGAGFPSTADRLITELARARALERVGRLEDAADLLAAAQARRPRGEPNLGLSVTRELGRLRALLAVGCDPANQAAKDSLRAYTAELEAELWSMHQARELSLRSRLAHERLRREHRAVAAQALADPLTGLPNRRALDEVLARVLAAPVGAAERTPLSVAMIDVDRFKQVNDIMSHARGDEVLRLVAGALRRSLRAGDMVARYGGDEFVVVLPGTSAADAAAALSRAVRAVAGLSGNAETDPAGWANRAQPGVTLSVGVVAVDPHEDADAVLGRADAAMYRVKHAGGDAVGIGGGDTHGRRADRS